MGSRCFCRSHQQSFSTRKEQKTSEPTKNESWASSNSAQRGSACLRMARASTMPTDFPPISPVPIMRFQMPSTSGKARYFATSPTTRWSRETAMCKSSATRGAVCSFGRPPRSICSQHSSAWRNVRVHLPRRRRIDSNPAHGCEVRISAVVELSVTGRNRLPSQRCSMYMVAE